MLIGQYKSKLTEKNRISVPKKIRDELGDEMVIAKWYEDCLVLVSSANWEKLLRRLIGKQEFVISSVRDIDRFIMAGAFEVSLDGQGRFVLPEELIKYANVHEEIVFIGLGDRVEIWAEEIWRELEKSAEEKAAKAIEKIAKEVLIDGQIKQKANGRKA